MRVGGLSLILLVIYNSYWSWEWVSDSQWLSFYRAIQFKVDLHLLFQLMYHHTHLLAFLQKTLFVNKMLIINWCGQEIAYVECHIELCVILKGWQMFGASDNTHLYMYSTYTFHL